MAIKMHVPPRNINFYHNMTLKSIQKDLRESGSEMNNYTSNKKKVFLFCYCAGHGVVDADT